MSEGGGGKCREGRKCSLHEETERDVAVNREALVVDVDERQQSVVRCHRRYI